jgi:sialate O-acetylesterase
VPKRDLLALKVPEAKDYQLVYDLDLENWAKTSSTTLTTIKTSRRLSTASPTSWSCSNRMGTRSICMCRWTPSPATWKRSACRRYKSGAHFQQNVANLNVYSNVKGIVTGAGLAGGNIEFWPNNYGPANSANVPNASGEVYDFGDEPTDPADGYGSMQVHNHDAKQTFFALNHWSEGSRADLGIGNQPANNPDWTFAGNAGTYQARRLRVLVRSK